MKPLNMNSVRQYVEENIGTFHQKRLEKLKELKLKNVLRKKNPYLFKAKYVLSADQIVRGLTDAYLSSSEEGIFGDWLEGLAIFINASVYGGWKSGITGVDLEFNRDGQRFIVAIKSGPNWGNSSQVAKMRSDFVQAAKTLRTSNSKLSIVAVNGCCYGRDNRPDKGDYFKYCGQYFWEFISGNPELYTAIIEPLGYQAKERNDEFNQEYEQTINRFVRGFMQDFCLLDGSIDWPGLVHFNSSK